MFMHFDQCWINHYWMFCGKNFAVRLWILNFYGQKQTYIWINLYNETYDNSHSYWYLCSCSPQTHTNASSFFKRSDQVSFVILYYIFMEHLKWVLSSCEGVSACYYHIKGYIWPSWVSCIVLDYLGYHLAVTVSLMNADVSLRGGYYTINMFR